MRIIGVLIGEASTCNKASATAVSSAVLLDSVVAPKCKGSEGETETGPYNWVCVCLLRVGVAGGWGG